MTPRPTAGEAATTVRWHSFRSMGTTVRLIGPEAPGFGAAMSAVERTFARLNDRFTRFTLSSELSTVNAGARSWTRVSGEFGQMTAALEAAERTEGLFDPTILPALLAAGYDRDFDELIAGARLALNPPEPCGRWRDVRLEGDRLLLPAGVSLDFGGIAKGWAADLAAELSAIHLPWALVDAGGDLRIAGDGLPTDGLDIAVEDPHDAAHELLRLRLTGGALATSSVTTRAWGRAFITSSIPEPAGRRAPGFCRPRSGLRRARRPKSARSGPCSPARGSSIGFRQ